MKRMVALVLLCAMLVSLGGCVIISKDEAAWVISKSDRSDQIVQLMDAGEMSRDQEQRWIRSESESWRIWKRKMQQKFIFPIGGSTGGGGDE